MGTARRARMVREESGDLTVLATRILEAAGGWLAKHPNVLRY
jgi:hypothetical protein